MQDAAPSTRATRAGKLVAPHYGQLCLLGARSERLARHEARACTGGRCEGEPTKSKMYKYDLREEYMEACRKKRNRARRERRRRAHKRLMAANATEKIAKVRGGQKQWRAAKKRKHNKDVQRQNQKQRRHEEKNRQIWARLQAILATAKSTETTFAAASSSRRRIPASSTGRETNCRKQ